MATSEVIDRPSGLVTPAVATAKPSSSLRRRLPLLTIALLGAVGLAFSWMAHREVERALRLNGHERVVAGVQQVSDLFAQSIAARTAEVKKLATDSEIRQLLQTPLSQVAAPPAVLQAVTTRVQPASVWLYDAQGHATGYLPLKSTGWQPLPTSGPALALPPEGISPLRIQGGQIIYRATAKVAAEGGVAGYVSLERPLSASPAGALIERLMGFGAALNLGNATRDLWTDLNKEVPAPPFVEPGSPTRYVNAKGDARLGTAIALAGTPWLLWGEMSERSLLAPARTLARRMIPITIVIMSCGALGIYVLSRRLTLPLEQLVAAADGIEGGDYSRRVATDRHDEIGRLGKAFNGMAARVAETHHDLEARVHARTTELEKTMQALRNTQEELVRRERLAMLGQLSSSVGHELRNPLGVMTNAVYYLKMIQADAPAQVGEYLGILQHQIGLAEKIVGDLLDFARLRAPQVQSVAMRQLIDEQLARLGPLDKLVVHRQGLDTLPAIQIDPVQIGQVLFNLFTNAQQAMENGGTLTISGRVDHGRVTIDVADTGRGVAPELLEKIFEPLFTTKARGIGLGLAVSRTLTASNGGDLTVASALGQGATFTLSFPLASTVIA